MNDDILPDGAPSPAPRRASIGARRNPASQAAILAAARAVLAEGGYAGFSIDAVSRLAGAGKPTIYRWWKTRADLLMDVYAAEKAAALQAPVTDDLAHDLTVYTGRLWDFWGSTPSGRTFRALIAEAQSNEGALETLRAKFLPERTQHLLMLFEKAAGRGEFAPAEVAMRLGLYIGFNWYYVLTDRLEEGRMAIAPAMRLIAAPSRP
ncbi:TetR-like C-terminal domain-containing protein [Bosea sp. (in: a-proteobacteria)]|jgi:AcrR family transcriptional regulator|uniref:TetR-like C-terminal domain-containing protein n=1 Tax=Bosea sp. (in: a-proteobacteria) TaxID=1871050 RepID=UPI003F71C066